jgi:NADH-quinone oxidoreductase subunit E
MSAAEGRFQVPPEVAGEIDRLVTHYPQKRSASLMVLHALQDHFGYLSPGAMEWTAARLGLEPIHIYELVTFYPMFRQEPGGKFHLKICRTLSCALGGSRALHAHLCKKLGLESGMTGSQTTKDGRFTVEMVECLAGCGTAPVMMCNEQFHESVSNEKAEQILEQCK